MDWWMVGKMGSKAEGLNHRSRGQRPRTNGPEFVRPARAGQFGSANGIRTTIVCVARVRVGLPLQGEGDSHAWTVGIATVPWALPTSTMVSPLG
jgi:hypothetical protein